MKLFLNSVIITALVVAVTSCQKSDRIPMTDNLIVATTTMLGDMLSVVGGEDVTVITLMRPGVDPHMYKASPSDVSKLNRAKAIFYNGMLLEGRMTDVLERLEKQGKDVYVVSDGVDESQRLAPEGADDHPDPHIWGDAALWAMTIPTVVDGLGKTFPEKADAFRERGETYQNDLTELHKWAQQRVIEIPAERRKLVTSHDAFSYLGRAYGLEVIGVQGISTVSDASVSDRTRMVDFIKEHKIPAVFVESSVSPVLIQQISKDANVTVGGELFSDAMGQPGVMETVAGETYDVGTYIGMLKHNINSIVEALK